MGLFDQGVVSSIIVSSGGGFQLVAAAGDAADGPVAGDAAYLVIASAAASAAVMGDGWMNGEMAGAAPIALAGYTVDNQTPVLDVLGSVVGRNHRTRKRRIPCQSQKPVNQSGAKQRHLCRGNRWVQHDLC